jgi:outer membrane lipoprotein SlyB
MSDEKKYDDNIQHGIDDNPENDAKKGAVGGGVGGAAVGAAAGSMVGPVGTAIGAIVGGVAGAVGSGAAVSAVDKHDNDNNMTGLGNEVQYDKNSENEVESEDDLVENDVVATEGNYELENENRH